MQEGLNSKTRASLAWIYSNAVDGSLVIQNGSAQAFYSCDEEIKPKRKRNKKEWARNKQKGLRVEGKVYSIPKK